MGAKLPDYIIELAKKYGVKVIRDMDELTNRAACAGGNIYLGYFDDTDIELVAFFHELGHVMCSCKRGSHLCTMSSEAYAWEVGLELAHENGHKWDYFSKPMEWAREQLKTYNEDENFQ